MKPAFITLNDVDKLRHLQTVSEALVQDLRVLMEAYYRRYPLDHLSQWSDVLASMSALRNLLPPEPMGRPFPIEIQGRVWRVTLQPVNDSNTAELAVDDTAIPGTYLTIADSADQAIAQIAPSTL